MSTSFKGGVELHLDMSKGRRKGEINKLPKSPTIVSPTKKKGESAPLLPPNAAKLEVNRTLLTSKDIFIAAAPDSCFGMLSSQLEQPQQWDPIVVNARPVSNVRGRIGATSQVTLNLGGRERESLAMISRYRPNRAISWVLTTKPKVREDWRLEPKAHGTVVGVTLACQVPGWAIGRLLYRIRRWKKVEQDLDKMLTHLKKVIESGSSDQRVIGNWRL